MVNPKTVLESPHTLPKTASKTTGGNFKPFDPLKYLTRTHRLAFAAVMKIWGKKPLKTYGARMSESVLTILCHILKGEKLIAAEREKAAQAEQARPNGPTTTASLVSAAVSGLGNPIPVVGGIGSSLAASLNELQARTTRAVSLLNEAAAPPPQEQQQQQQPPEVNQEHVATLMDMGFTRERCIEALQAHSSLEQATDYLLNNPVPPQRSSSDSTSAAAGGSEASRGGGIGLPAAVLAASAPGTGPAGSSGGNEQDDLMRAIAM